LTPAKSLTLGPLSVPDEYFTDFFRGCIDGDGSVLIYTDRYHVAKKESYVYERLYVSIVSASHSFIEWLQTTVSRLIGVEGSIAVTSAWQKSDVDSPLCQGSIPASARLDVLRAERSLSRKKAYRG